MLFVIVFDDSGRAHYEHCSKLDNFIKHITLALSEGLVYSVMAFYSDPRRGKHVCKGFLYKRGPGVRYSPDEQPTGDLWTDGRPIYQLTKMFSFSSLQSGASSIVISGTGDVSSFIDARVNYSSSSLYPAVCPLGPFALAGNSPASQMFTGPTVAFTSIEKVNSTSIKINIVSNAPLAGGGGYVTIWYTRQGDQPVTDG
jgi:hypothetical protein